MDERTPNVQTTRPLGLTEAGLRLFSHAVGVSPPKPVVARKTGTVPDSGRVLAAGDCPEFSADRKVFLSPDYKEEQLRDTADGSQLTAHSLPLDSDSGPSAVSRWPLALVICSLYYPDSPYEFSLPGNGSSCLTACGHGVY